MSPSHGFFLALVCSCACATAPGDLDDDSTSGSAQAESTDSDAFVGPQDADRKAAMYRELLAATAADDPARADICERLAKAELAAGRAEPACAEQPLAATSSDDDCGGDAELACAERGVGSCCYRESIKYEYEMLEARSRGQEAAARKHAVRLQELWRRACEGGIERACEDLRRRGD